MHQLWVIIICVAVVTAVDQNDKKNNGVIIGAYPRIDSADSNTSQLEKVKIALKNFGRFHGQ